MHWPADIICYSYTSFLRGHLVVYGGWHTSAGGGNSPMSKSVCILLSALLIAPLASAEIFKCVGKDGTDLYQNFPCQFDSMGWKPMNPQGPKATSATIDSSPAPPKAIPVEAAAPGKSPTPPGEPRIGMTTAEVKALWGEAADTYYDELVDGRVEVWSYSRSRSVTFDVKGRVAAIQR